MHDDFYSGKENQFKKIGTEVNRHTYTEGYLETERIQTAYHSL